jgi:outer membrane immunogenic protein
MQFTSLGRLAISALLIAAPLSFASAADMPVKAPKPAPAPAFDWNGFYIGAYAGAAWMDQARTNDPCLVAATAFCLAAGVGTFTGQPPATYDMKSSFIGGGTLGFNWQPTPYTLLGLENQIGYIHLTGRSVINVATLNDTVASTKIGDWYDAYTVRIGATDGHAMFYLKGGGVSAQFSTGVVRNVLPVTLNTTTSKTLTGWAAGGGIEYGIDMHWSVKAEYLVLGLPSNTNTCGPVGGFPPGTIDCTTTHIPNVQTITLGLNYRFR